jgi:hypothetical protein
MDDLRRIHYVTEHYAQLQGLRLLPLSVPFLLAAGERVAGASLVPAGMWSLLVVAAVAAPYPIGRYYARRFGQVRPPRWRTGALTLIACTAVFLWFEWLQETLSPSVSLPLLFVATLLARLGLVAGRLRGHYLWIAAAVGLFAVLARAGVSPDARAIAGNLLIGGSLAVAGLGDDRLLRRVLTPGPDQSLRSAA